MCHVTLTFIVQLEWKAPDQEGLIQFLVGEKDFNRERVLATLKRLKTGQSLASQQRLESFFKPIIPANADELKKKKAAAAAAKKKEEAAALKGKAKGLSKFDKSKKAKAEKAEKTKKGAASKKETKIEPPPAKRAKLESPAKPVADGPKRPRRLDDSDDDVMILDEPPSLSTASKPADAIHTDDF